MVCPPWRDIGDRAANPRRSASGDCQYL